VLVYHKREVRFLPPAIVAAAAWLLFSAQAPGPSREERLSGHRNLGKAFYENPTTQLQAVDELRRALDFAPDSARDRLNYGLALLRAGKTEEGVAELERVQKQDPSIPHTWFNLGIQAKKTGGYDRATTQLERMARLVPDEPITQYNLGTLYRLAGDNARAAASFERAAQLDPSLAAPHFALFNLYRQTGRAEEAKQHLAIFQELKKQQEGAAVPEDVEWSFYAELLDEIPATDSRAVPAPAKYTGMILPGTFVGVAATDLNNDGLADLVAWGPRLVRAFRSGATIAPIAGALYVAPGDFNNDGFVDLCVLTSAGPVLLRNTRGVLRRHAAELPQGTFRRALWVDYDHDNDLDLFLFGDRSALARNQGVSGFADRTQDFPFEDGRATEAAVFRLVPDTRAFDIAVAYDGRAAVLYRDRLTGKYEAGPLPASVASIVAPRAATAAADFNGDGRLDQVVVAAGGGLTLRLNRSPSGPWIGVRLAGVKSLRLAAGAEVEVKAGTHYRKQVYEGIPLVFDLGGRAVADTVRITWPNGLIQNEVKQAAGRFHTYKEAQRLSGSCPMIWTWDGQTFRFITDVLGVAPLGASSGDGEYFPVDHDEYVSIPAGALTARDGAYEVRITEELSEVTYLDEVKLFAVDHLEGVEVLTNEKFKGPPFPEFRLYGVTRRTPPSAARDHHGRNVLARVAARDRRYPGGFVRTHAGIAERHSLELEFDPAALRGPDAALILHGWVDWADGSTFLGQAQEGAGLVFPYLEARDPAGVWRTVVEDMGLPAGKPKTIVVPLEGRVPEGATTLRIVTNLCVYWDEISVGQATRPALQPREIPVLDADLRFRGFSRTVIHPQRKQPEMFFYPDPRPTSFWNPTRGLYTRYGAVRHLLAAEDDRLVILGSGDEVRLRFDARDLPALTPRARRTFLLKVDGWAKDRDANTVFSQTVEPIPFHGMSRYPYPASERYPERVLEESRQHNTRPALRLLRDLR